MILVGDTLAMVVLGYDDTLHVTVDDMALHIGRRANATRALVIGDLPWMSYHVTREETVRNAAALVRAGAGAVKLEGGRKRVDAVRAILDAEIPVMGHVGLTPQFIHAFGGFKVQGKTIDTAAIVDDGRRRGRVLRRRARVQPRRGGAPGDRLDPGADDRHRRRHCDGQVLVYHDLLGMQDWLRPKFVRQRRVPHRGGRRGVAPVGDVRQGTFPSSEEYHVADDLTDALRREGVGDATPVTA